MIERQPRQPSGRKDETEEHFGLRGLQLALLAGMRPYAPERVRAVLEALGVTPEQAAAAEDRWFGGNRPENSGNARKEPTWSIANLQRVLGPPVVEEPSDRLRAGGWRAGRCRYGPTCSSRCWKPRADGCGGR